ncbi:enterobactin/ferric enterobactin esterase [Crateriforma conspicua]|uniref:Enterobactin/ferric enterobactin esterase n=1 Tax=Crateriforma conspicua TaxID=2527996 RepID=A0A5C6FRR9_9PLAN|nr:alpha/beta hydrolase-fold protein [Crateriforma conspicua]TWU65787.1 enterobactin/ferric enterobactin esterase [Crateriforma conspicua]
MHRSIPVALPVSALRRGFVFLCFSLAATSVVPVSACAEEYEIGPDSQVQDVPHGKVTQYEWTESQVFPGTKRRYSVYVPAQYDGSSPAALMVFQDGHNFEQIDSGYRVPVVFDNLIAKGQMPVTIAVMIDPGTHKELPEKRGWKPTPTNRSFEYDTVSGDYAEFLLTEILPEVEKEYRITQNPELRAICGNSSGGICAFGVAWHRPDSFRKVVSHIGSFVNIRGGHNYEAMVRKTDKKPLRVFMQDGSGDLDNVHGNWPLANQELSASLKFKGYDHKFVYGTGGHNGEHGTAIFPDTLRWVWRGWEKETP